MYVEKYNNINVKKYALEINNNNNYGNRNSAEVAVAQNIVIVHNSHRTENEKYDQTKTKI